MKLYSIRIVWNIFCLYLFYTHSDANGLVISNKVIILTLGDAGGPRLRRSYKILESLGYKVDFFAESIPSIFNVENSFLRKDLLGRNSFFRTAFNFFVGKLWRFRGYLPGWLADFINDIGFKLDRVDYFLPNDYKIILVEDLFLLPLAFRKRAGGIIIFDAREFYPKEFEGNRLFDLYEKPARESLCRRYLSKCDAVMTVSPGLVSQYNIDYNISPILFRSLPYYHCLSTKKTENINIKMVHMGIANRDRKIEKMIEIAEKLKPEYSLDFYLVGNQEYVEQLKQSAKLNPRIRFQPPVKFDDIIPTLNQYDIGFYHLEPSGFNTTYNLPNKLFEFIQARLAVVVSPNPCMAEVVRNYSCGFVSNDYGSQSMVELLNGLDSEKIDLAKHKSHEAASELCYEKEKYVLENLIFQLTLQKSRGVM